MVSSDKNNIYLSVILMHSISINYSKVIFITCVTYRSCVIIHKEMRVS